MHRTIEREIINEMVLFANRRIFDYRQQMKHKKRLNESIEGDSPDELEFMGDIYVALEDDAFPIIYHQGEWISDESADTHRDLICLKKYGCLEWQVEEYYSWPNQQTIFTNLNRLWSENDEFRWPSRIFSAYGNARRSGIKYILVSWDFLDEEQVESICNTFGIDRNELVYVETVYEETIKKRD